MPNPAATAVKVCINCRYYTRPAPAATPPHWRHAAMCTHPACVTLVLGDARACHAARADRRLCGRDGQHFELSDAPPEPPAPQMWIVEPQSSHRRETTVAQRFIRWLRFGSAIPKARRFGNIPPRRNPAPPKPEVRPPFHF
jgi:hypothetical protein